MQIQCIKGVVEGRGRGIPARVFLEFKYSTEILLGKIN